MSYTTINLETVVLDEPLDEFGFRHVASSVRTRRIGAGIYEAEAGAPIWPYHYHHGVEEWLYVVAGAPVLRDPSGRRVLAPGDLVVFPSGHLGAHTLEGPGRFVILATGYQSGPFMSVYPDSDKVSGPGGILLRSAAVGYWHGEGTAPADPTEHERESEFSPPQPVVNVLGAPGGAIAGERFAATLLDLAPGAKVDEFHCAYGREEWVLMLAGSAVLRHAGGEGELSPGDLACLPEGPDGAYELRGGAEPARVLVLATTGFPANVWYPESGRWVLRNGPDEREHVRSATGIHHIDLAVADVERSLAFYDTLLGPLGLEEYDRYPSYRGTEEVVYLRFGGQLFGLRPADGGKVTYYHVGIEHLAFRVDTAADVDSAYQRCLAAGIPIHYPPEPDRDVADYYAFFVFDPDGFRIEVFAWDE